ncbi:hypothetical protein M0R04_14985 [Candidatus Dojkabacteria bacterium]|jgi:hypothetical protein|nr:hypothetical protein [Candidatus Dojkabacteria bacterium]
MRNIKKIYEMHVSGDSITDEELLLAIPFFKKLAADLVQCGPTFVLAFKEANNVYYKLRDYAFARDLNIPKVFDGMTSESMKKVNKFKRNLLSEQLSLCTIAQQEMFGRMYVSVSKIPDSKIPRAFEQIEETIKRNNEKSWDE